MSTLSTISAKTPIHAVGFNASTDVGNSFLIIVQFKRRFFFDI